MATLLDVNLRSAETVDQEIAQAFFGAREITSAIERSQNIVVRNLSVEGRNKTAESLFSDGGVDFVLLHVESKNGCSSRGRIS